MFKKTQNLLGENDAIAMNSNVFGEMHFATCKMDNFTKANTPAPNNNEIKCFCLHRNEIRNVMY